MTNTQYVYPPYFGTLRELIRHAEAFASNADTPLFQDQQVSRGCYELGALNNLVGELQCMIGECERRARYLEAKLAEDV